MSFRIASRLRLTLSFLQALGQLREILVPHSEQKLIGYSLALRPESELDLTHGVLAVR